MEVEQEQEWDTKATYNPLTNKAPSTLKKRRRKQDQKQSQLITVQRQRKRPKKTEQRKQKQRTPSKESRLTLGATPFQRPISPPKLRQGQPVFGKLYEPIKAPSGPSPFASPKSTQQQRRRQQKGKQQRQQQPQREQRKLKFGGLNMNDWVFFINDERVSDDVRDQRFPMNLNTLSEVLSNYLDLTDCFWRQDINIPKRIDVSNVEKNLLQFSEKDDFQFCNDAKFREELDSFKYLTEEDEDKFRSELRKRTPPTKSSLPRTSEIGKYPTKQWRLFTDNPHQKIFASKMGYSKFK